ncbi:GNAT family N-acetyltransferase [Nibribacter ruber]|uniref:GNAT family N-acetyltransferase n=1 Tax=Nibribacter ruber TaxID=2698458 RepID=A0A6P1P1S6_9BACT|nr:GNAT family N-acetyltransferase [Nibribacter ruber]QHL87732.1 GNAT family N-acetyltransferase [Nibribacter ruber]
MIQLLSHQEIDLAQWEACLASCSHSLVYAHAWYLNVVTKNSWQALVEMKDGKYVSVFPLPLKKWIGHKQVYQPLFTQQLGLFTTSDSTHTAVEEYLEVLAQHFQQVQYQLPSTASFSLPTQKGWQMRLRPNYELSLAASYESIYKDYSQNLKRSLKKGAQASLHSTLVSSPDAVIHLFSQTKGKELPNLQARHYAILKKLVAQAQKHSAGEVWEIRQAGELLIGAIILRDAHRITFLFGASSAQGRKLGAMGFLLNHLIEQVSNQDIVFDFEGSEVPGVANFYAGFGAEPVSYLSLSFQRSNTSPSWTRTVFASLAKRLP